jgi:hypothetical protein
VEYALQYSDKPIGVATYRLQNALPKSLQDNLPTIEQLEVELNAAIAEIERQEPSDQ